MKYFYFDVSSQAGVESSDPLDGSVNEILAVWDSLSRESGSFLGIRCSGADVVQFMLDDSLSVTIDVPLPARGGSLMKHSSIEECVSVIEQVCRDDSLNAIEGLKFTQW